MDTALNQRELEVVFDQVVREVTEKAAGVRLCSCVEPPGGNLCTVYAAFKKGFHSSVSLCADTGVLTRMTRTVVRSETITNQDLEDFTKEYFNLLCGQIAAALFRVTHVASRFGLPSFYEGRFEPEGQERQFELNYSAGQQEGMQLVHHVPQFDQERGNQK